MYVYIELIFSPGRLNFLQSGGVLANMLSPMAIYVMSLGSESGWIPKARVKTWYTT